MTLWTLKLKCPTTISYWQYQVIPSLCKPNFFSQGIFIFLYQHSLRLKTYSPHEIQSWLQKTKVQSSLVPETKMLQNRPQQVIGKGKSDFKG